MSESEFNAIFSKRLKYYLNKYDMTQSELAKRLNVSTQSVTNWCKGDKSPRMDKVDAMCKIFHCRRSDLMEDKSSEPQTTATPKIMTYYDHLNDLGKREATKRVQELTYFPQYSASEPMLNAAHADDYANTPDELKQLEEDMIDKAFRPN